MKRNLLLIEFLFLSYITWGQVKPNEGGIFSQFYSKEITDYKAKEYIVLEILKVPNKKVIDLETFSLTASKSGELTTILYNCESLKKRGLIFAFWNETFNEFNTRYKGYAFRNFDFNEARQFLDTIAIIVDEKKKIINADNSDLSKNAIYKWDDLTFVFYKGDIASNLIRVFWNGFDSEWNQSNLLTTKKRFEKFFDISK